MQELCIPVCGSSLRATKLFVVLFRFGFWPQRPPCGRSCLSLSEHLSRYSALFSNPSRDGAVVSSPHSPGVQLGAVANGKNIGMVFTPDEGNGHMNESQTEAKLSETRAAGVAAE